MSLAWGIFGGILGLVWLWRGAEVAFGMRRVAEITARQWDRRPPTRVTIVVPAKDEGESIEQCLSSLLALDYDNYEIVAVDDRRRFGTPRRCADRAGIMLPKCLRDG